MALTAVLPSRTDLFDVSSRLGENLELHFTNETK